jgi:fucose permease
VTLPRDRTVRRKLVFLLALFSIYVGGEVLTSSWMTAWLVGVYGMTVPDAAPYMVAFFTLLACARLLCFAFLRPSWEIPILIGVLTMSIAFQITAHQGLPLAIAGCGILGPFFPILLARVSRQFPNEWRAFLLGLMLAIPTAMTLFQALVARAADVWGMSLAFKIPLFLQITAFALLLGYLIAEKSGIPEK